MPLFNSAPLPYVREELLRRIKGLAKHIPGVPAEDRYWHHQKTPYIRIVSNAVPLPDSAGSTKEGEKKEELWNGEFSNSTRFEHILFAGHAKGKDTDTFGRREGFDQMYSGIYKFNDILKLNYNFSYDRDMDYSNYDALGLNFGIFIMIV